MRFTQTVYRFLTVLPLCALLQLCACGGVSSAAVSAAGGVVSDALESAAVDAGLRTVAPVSVDPGSIPMPEASGETVYTGGGLTLDASHTGDGYIMAASEPNEKRIMTRVSADGGTYTYRQKTDETYETYPLQMGDGDYGVEGFEQVQGDRYARIFNKSLPVTLSDATAPFLYPNQYVPYTATDDIVSASYTITDGLTDPAKIADKLYRYVARNIVYDEEKARTVQEGYLPVPDETLATGKGICFDYAALLAAMLRVQGIPARLVIGHVQPDNIYHAWNQAYINGKWIFYDATLASEQRPEENYQPERLY